jgi:hypothetical protein
MKMQIFPDGTFVLGGIETEDAVMEGARIIPDDSEEALAILAKQGKEEIGTTAEEESADGE